MYKATFALGFFVILLGYLDCLTTVVGVSYLGCIELNPLVAGLVHSNMAVFVLLKLVCSLLVAGVIVVVEHVLSKYKLVYGVVLIAQRAIRAAYTGMLAFISLVVLNNLFVIIN